MLESLLKSGKPEQFFDWGMSMSYLKFGLWHVLVTKQLYDSMSSSLFDTDYAKVATEELITLQQTRKQTSSPLIKPVYSATLLVACCNLTQIVPTYGI